MRQVSLVVREIHGEKMDYKRLAFSLFLIFVGWLLAQFTGLMKDYLYRRKIRKCLIEELNGLQSELERTLLIYSRQLQIHSLKGIDDGSPIPLSNHIFRNYYKDVVLSLNKHQRISLQLIHTMIESVNTGISEHEEITSRLQEKHVLGGEGAITEEEGQLWGNKVISEFTNVALALWHIKFHLSRSKSPDLSPYTEAHKQYLKYLDNVNKKIRKTMDAAKELDRSEFERIYNPENIAKQFL